MNTVAHHWRFAAEKSTEVAILPDGCRDLILSVAPNTAPEWFFSALSDGPHVSRSRIGVQMIGTRFSPGTVINEGRLLQALSEKHLDETEQQSRILENSQRCLKVQECLSCIAESLSPIPSVASELGVSVRSLQRVVSDATGYSPVYWRALARVRKAARQLQNATPLVEISVNAGFSDQSHMNREFQRWFGVSPSAFAETPGFLEQLQSPAYC